MKKLLLIFTLLLWIPTANADEEKWQKGLSAYETGYYSDAYNIWEPLAELNHIKSQYYLGRLYAEGKGVLQNNSIAVEWYRKAAKQGHPEAQQKLGAMYQRGLGVSRDYEEAEKWYLKAIERGSSATIALLNELNLLQVREAAKNGNVEAQLYLASKYFTGLHDDGINIPQNYTSAFFSYEEIAKRGVAEAQSKIGYMYHHGVGIAKDEAEAVEWYRKAAEQGDAEAQHNLGTMYINSLAVNQDDMLAYMWLSLAIENGNERSKISLNSVRTSMTKTDRQKAQKMARHCLESNYTKCGEKPWWKLW